MLLKKKIYKKLQAHFNKMCHPPTWINNTGATGCEISAQELYAKYNTKNYMSKMTSHSLNGWHRNRAALYMSEHGIKGKNSDKRGGCGNTVNVHLLCIQNSSKVFQIQAVFYNMHFSYTFY